MQDLFKKYLNNQCSSSEIKEVLDYFNVGDNETQVRSLIAESLEFPNNEKEEAQWEPATDAAFLNIKREMVTGEKIQVRRMANSWLKVAAAVLLLVGGFAIFRLSSNEKKGSTQAINNPISAEEIHPGSNKATLTLANGSTISLETAGRGVLAQQGNTEITKAADGQLAYQSSQQTTSEVFFNTIATPRAGQYQVTLTDGTRAWLNAASSLRYPVNFSGKERKVILNGEAYFEVAKNTEMPFKVVIGNSAEVEVLGTHFNVNAYTEEATINTTLLEGKVKVVALTSGSATIIAPGEQARLTGQGKISIDKNINKEQAIAWKNGIFDFNNANLEVVFRQLARWYDIEVVFEGSVSNRRFIGEMQRDLELSRVLNLLEKNNVFCRLEGRRLTVLK